MKRPSWFGVSRGVTRRDAATQTVTAATRPKRETKLQDARACSRIRGRHVDNWTLDNLGSSVGACWVSVSASQLINAERCSGITAMAPQ